MESSPFSETTTTTLEWKVSSLKKIFESSKGEGKSKVVKSAKFGGGKWQILFYPNSGTDGGVHVSLYLSCEPTPEEREKATNGKWERDGQFKFSFELRNVSKNVLFNSKEAFNHSFSWKTANWGWAQFSRRDVVYYQASSVKAADAFIIICVITSSPSPPISPPTFPMQSVPRQLMDSVGCLLDDPLYSDVEFILPPPKGRGEPKLIWAMKPILSRTEYFDTMLNSGFLEDSTQVIDSHSQRASADSDTVETPSTASPPYDADDSDFEDESDEEAEVEEKVESTPKPKHEDPNPNDIQLPFSEGQDDFETLTNSEGDGANDERTDEGSATVTREGSPNDPMNESMTSWQTATIERRDKSPTSREATPPPAQKQVPGPVKAKIVVKDVAFRTYYAMLYYLYTDTIVFAPLSSSFSSPAARTPLPLESAQLPLSASGVKNEGQSGIALAKQTPESDSQTPKPRSRKEWIKEWSVSHPWHAEPCSAKSIYKLADKLDLHELKSRAAKHIIKSMTVENVPHEMFSSFSARYEEVRKIQIDFFLSHWAEIRASEVMTTIWQQIRSGRHPGFEEVWPLVALNLEFKPSPPNEETDDKDHLGDDGR